MLGLSDRAIETHVVNDAELYKLTDDATAAGYCVQVPERNFATLYLLDEPEGEFTSPEHIVVHELLHVLNNHASRLAMDVVDHYVPADSQRFVAERLRLANEQLVDSLASAFVRLATEGEK